MSRHPESPHGPSETGRNRIPDRRRCWQGALLVAVLGLAVGAALPATVQRSGAVWTDTTSSNAQVEAAVIPAPTLTDECAFDPGLLGIGAAVEIYWQLPEGYTLDDVVVEASTEGLGSALAPLAGFNLDGANTDQNPDGTYTTEVGTDLLGGLLGQGGSELEIAFAVADDSGWQSEHASVASNAGLLGGISGNCRNLT